MAGNPALEWLTVGYCLSPTAFHLLVQCSSLHALEWLTSDYSPSTDSCHLLLRHIFLFCQLLVIRFWMSQCKCVLSVIGECGVLDLCEQNRLFSFLRVQLQNTFSSSLMPINVPTSIAVLPSTRSIVSCTPDYTFEFQFSFSSSMWSGRVPAVPALSRTQLL